MAKAGVMPLDTASEEVSAPVNSSVPAPLAAVPMEKYATVEVPPVQVGKVTAAALENVPAAVVQPPEVRATATRA